MKAITLQRNQSYLFLIATIVYLIYILATGQATLFYVVYIFWCEELIRYIFEVVFYKTFQKKIENHNRFDNLKYSRLGFLLFHWFMIYALYGFAQLDREEINTDIIQFKNSFFNTYLLLTLIKTFWFWQRKIALARTQKVVQIEYSENGIWVLHISMIMGFAIMFLISPNSSSPLSTLQNILIITPFICVKTLAEFITIRYQFNKAINDFSDIDKKNVRNQAGKQE